MEDEKLSKFDTSQLVAEIVFDDAASMLLGKNALERNAFTTEAVCHDEIGIPGGGFTIMARRKPDLTPDEYYALLTRLIGDGFLFEWGYPYLTPAPEEVLAAIGNGARYLDIVEALGGNCATTDVALDALEQRGLIRRHAEDRHWFEPAKAQATILTFDISKRTKELQNNVNRTRL